MYQLSVPHAALQPYIEHYWHVFATPEQPFDFSVDVFVDLRADLIFNFGAPYHRTANDNTRVRVTHSNLDAQRLHPIRIEQRGAVVVTGARFRTGGLMPFVRHPLNEWTDRIVPLDEAFGDDARDLEATLLDAGAHIAPQTQALDAFFAARFSLTPHMELVLRLKSLQEHHGGSLRIDHLADMGNTTLRTVDRLFRRHIGVSPKTFARVTRFQRSLNRLKTDPGVSLGSVATECGFADQSHFVRDFKRFTGVAPSRQLGYFPPGAPVDFSPNVVRFVQDGASG